MAATDHTADIRDAGLRVTRPRLAVMAAVDAHPHAETEAVLAAVREELPGVSRQAVYDVLHALTDAGLIRRIQPSGHVSLYETRIADNHHHLVCRVCGDVRDVDCAVGEAPCLEAVDDHGFRIDEAEVIYWGVCPACAANTDTTRAPDDPGGATR
ncbi:Fur family transcriptional regulator [Gordonia phthalatica]|uniref:Fur family transcriptional regulator n=1 Tax=Gordonia phthalatica TaxID=1136941 RepID=A0A0N9N2K2_9ACTN|nr:Fur family transcriptional regulator [Gordonia phthalatica]ALG84869.1 Fur family transcriptional regulator [Gordonia phthalatica]